MNFSELIREIGKLIDEKLAAFADRYGLKPQPDTVDPDEAPANEREYGPDGWSLEHQPRSGACYSKGVAELRAELVEIARSDENGRRRKLAQRLLGHDYLNSAYGAKYSAKRLDKLRELDPAAFADLTSSVSYADFRNEVVSSTGKNRQDLNAQQLAAVIDFRAVSTPSGYTQVHRGPAYPLAYVVPNVNGKTDKETAEWVRQWVEAVFKDGFHAGGSAAWVSGG